MSIELGRRVKQLEQQLAELNRQIAEILADGFAHRREQVDVYVTQPLEPEKRKPGRPRKNG